MVQKRYFIELTYKGTHYSGFQIQDNAPTVQGHVQQAFQLALKENINLTGSSRTDAGVHALQNFFHFDTPPWVFYQNNYLKVELFLPRKKSCFLKNRKQLGWR